MSVETVQIIEGNMPYWFGDIAIQRPIETDTNTSQQQQAETFLEEVPVVYQSSTFEDYQVLFEFTKTYGDGVRSSIEDLIAMGCVCPTNHAGSGFSLTIPGMQSIFEGGSSEHQHCEHCQSDLIDGYCPRCGCSHSER